MTLAATQPVPIARPQAGWLSWAPFLGMSWTWCIGMFLPVILVRDYGILGWIVFAVPNVIGAAAMGWVIRSAESSERIVNDHWMACSLFSGVTIAFHMFFVVAVIAPLALSMTAGAQGQARSDEAMDLALGGVLAVAILLYVYMTRRPDADRTLAWVTLLISAAVIVVVLPELSLTHLNTAKLLPIKGTNPSDLVWLAPVCVFGFLGCPYLDLTFHRARQFSNQARASFGVGFVGVFFPMIIFTLLYAQAMTGGSMTRLVAALLFIHMAVQSSFTIAAHARELQRNGRIAAIAAAVLTVFSVGLFWSLHSQNGTNIRTGEMIYRSFMGFYGLIFPAYVWLVMLPGHGRVGPTIPRLIVYGVIVLIALPMFTLGFLFQRPIWLVPGLAVVLLARLAIRSDAEIRGFEPV